MLLRNRGALSGRQCACGGAFPPQLLPCSPYSACSVSRAGRGLAGTVGMSHDHQDESTKHGHAPQRTTQTAAFCTKYRACPQEGERHGQDAGLRGGGDASSLLERLHVGLVHAGRADPRMAARGRFREQERRQKQKRRGGPARARTRRCIPGCRRSMLPRAWRRRARRFTGRSFLREGRRVRRRRRLAAHGGHQYSRCAAAVARTRRHATRSIGRPAAKRHAHRAGARARSPCLAARPVPLREGGSRSSCRESFRMRKATH